MTRGMWRSGRRSSWIAINRERGRLCDNIMAVLMELGWQEKDHREDKVVEDGRR